MHKISYALSFLKKKEILFCESYVGKKVFTTFGVNAMLSSNTLSLNKNKKIPVIVHLNLE